MSGPTQASGERLPLIDPATALEGAVNDIYEAIIDDDEEENNEDAIWLREQRTLNKATHWMKRPSAVMISCCAFGVAFATSSGEATRNMITLKLACNYLASSSHTGVCDPSETQLLVSNLLLAVMILAGVFLLIALGKMGPLSDQYGRKPFLAAIIGSFLVARVTRFYLMYHYDTLRFGWIVFSEIFGNMFGGVMSFVTLANCYISDVVEPHERIYSLGLGMAGLFVGLSLGPVVGNFILSKSMGSNKTASMKQSYYSTIDHAEYRPLQFEIVVFALVLIVFMIVVPELRSAKARGKSRSLSRSLSMSAIEAPESAPRPHWLQVLNPNFLKPLRLLTLPEDAVTNAHRRNLPRERIVIMTLVIVDCFLMCLSVPMGQVFVLYGIYSFDWTSIEIGHLLAVSCSARAVALLLVSPILTRKVLHQWCGFTMMKRQYDLIDFSICVIGLVAETIGFLLVYTAPSTNLFLLAMVFNSLSSFTSPALNSTIIKFYPESKIGEVFGALALVKNFFAILSPIGILSVYKLSVSKWHNPGIVYLILSALTFVCLLALITTKKLSNLTRETRPVLSRSGSSVSYENPGDDSIAPSLPSHNSLTDLHRKNSFVQRLRSQT